MKTQQRTQQEQLFSVAHFLDFGARYGIDYHFPTLSTGEEARQSTVVRGYVDEIILPSGLCVTCSDLHVVEPYESTSRESSPLYILVVLEGCVTLQINGHTWRVRPGMVLATSLDEHQVLNARHQGDERLVTVSLAIHPARFCPQSGIAALLDIWRNSPTTGLWTVPTHVMTGLRSALFCEGNPAARQLILEGILLQLLGHQLLETRNRPACAPGERHRLEQVRQLLESTPEHPFTLDSLASIAAMSPVSLRNKFRQAYGDSVFNYLRDCRLALARRYLIEGYSVQEAAWMSGYQHATNFATAFRRRYGVAPSAFHQVA